MPVGDPIPDEDPSAAHLHARLGLVSQRLAAMADPSLDPAQVDAVLERCTAGLAELDEQADAIEADTGPIAVRSVARAFGLGPREVDIVLLSMLVDLVPDARARCAAFNGAAEAVRPSIALALSAVGLPVDHHRAAGLFGEARPLVRHHLVTIDGFDRPLTTRRYTVPDRVARAMWGIDEVDPLLRNLQTPLIGVPSPEAGEVAAAVRAGVRSVYIRERPAASGFAFAAAVIDELGIAGVGFDLRRAGPDHHPYGLAAAAVREGGLLDAAVVVGPIDSFASRDVESLSPMFEAPWPVFMVGSVAWEPSWSRIIPLTVDAPRAEQAEVARLWASTTADHGRRLGEDADAVISVLRLTPEQTVRAAVAAGLAAASSSDRGVIGGAHVRIGARSQSAGRLEQLADRIEPRARLSDLVLAPGQLDQVQQVVERGRHRDLVLDEWGMGGGGARGRGITALFAGDSGTGKTLSAEAIAGELGVDLYVIDLSTVVDKYVGETEKNLGRVFDEAEGINGVLFFDEADALFGKRGETSDAHDRYANVEVAYLLQRMERFDGVAILATNLRSNIDEAFTRRLDIIVHFTIPDVEHRRLLWERHLPPTLPVADDLDLDFLARRFELAGGVIRNIALTAAYRAAQTGGRVAMADLVRATSTEYSKMGRLFDTSVLGAYAAHLDT